MIINLKLKIILSVVILLLIILGGSASFYLSQQTQDLRQQASGGVVCSSSTTNTSCGARPGCDWEFSEVSCGVGDCNKDGCSKGYSQCTLDNCSSHATCKYTEAIPAQMASCGSLLKSACDSKSNCSWKNQTTQNCTSNDCSNNRNGCGWEYSQCTINDLDKPSCSPTYGLGSCGGFNNGCSTKTSNSSCSSAPSAWNCQWSPGSVNGASGEYQSGCSGSYVTSNARCDGGQYQKSPAVPASCSGQFADATKCTGTYVSTTEGSCSGTPAAYCSTQVEDDCGRNGLGCIKDLNGGKCEERQDECSSGEKKCSGTGAAIFCKANGTWSDPVTCPSGKQCLSSTKQCGDKYCSTFTKSDCLSNGGYGCIKDFNGGTCEERYTGPDSCSSGANKCIGTNQTSFCKSDGRWSDPINCQTGNSCIEDKCRPLNLSGGESCLVDRQCNSNKCASGKCVSNTCNIDSDCPTDYSCISGPGAKFCSPDDQGSLEDIIIPIGETCNTTAYDRNCESGSVCVEGRCKEKECEESICLNEDYAKILTPTPKPRAMSKIIPNETPVNDDNETEFTTNNIWKLEYVNTIDNASSNINDKQDNICAIDPIKDVFSRKLPRDAFDDKLYTAQRYAGECGVASIAMSIGTDQEEISEIQNLVSQSFMENVFTFKDPEVGPTEENIDPTDWPKFTDLISEVAKFEQFNATYVFGLADPNILENYLKQPSFESIIVNLNSKYIENTPNHFAVIDQYLQAYSNDDSDIPVGDYIVIRDPNINPETDILPDGIYSIGTSLLVPLDIFEEATSLSYKPGAGVLISRPDEEKIEVEIAKLQLILQEKLTTQEELFNSSISLGESIVDTFN